jgi:hypothetical protein
MSTKEKIAVAICFICHLICLKLGFIVPLLIQASTAPSLGVLYVYYRIKTERKRKDDEHKNHVENERIYRENAYKALEEYLYKPNIAYFVIDKDTRKFGFPKSISDTWWVFGLVICGDHLRYRLFLAKQIFIGEYTDLFSLIKKMIFYSTRSQMVDTTIHTIRWPGLKPQLVNHTT